MNRRDFIKTSTLSAVIIPTMELPATNPLPLDLENRPLTEKESILYKEWGPKTINRFICYIKNKNETDFIPSFLLKKMDRPSCYKDNGKWQWNPINIEVYDPIVPSASQIFYTYITKPQSLDMLLKILGPVGDVVEEWDIKNAEFTYIDFGNLDWSGVVNDKATIDHVNVKWYYKGSEPLTIKARISYDFAKLNY
jgi:hypothetical protein